jgi:hypothetical protein
LLVVYLWPIDRQPGVNVYAHIDQAAAIVVDGTLTIDRFVRQPYPNTIDWALAPNGHYYPAKAPGAALLAVVPFFALYHAERRLGVDPLSPQWWRRNAVLINWLVNAVVAAWVATLLVRLGRALGVGDGPSVAGALAIALGTAFYPYATVYYAHVPAANAIVGAALLVFASQPRSWSDAAAGALAGTAVLFDYPAVFALLFLAAAVAAMRPRGVIAFTAGALLPLTVLCAYHALAFGNPFATSYAYQNPEFASEEGLFLNQPSLHVLRELTLGRYRGVFIYSPVLLLATYGTWRGFSGRGVPSERVSVLRIYTAVAVGTFVCWLLLNASYRVWWGGYTAGPRLIVPALVLLAPLVGIGIQRFPIAGFILLGISVVNYFAIASVWVRLNEAYFDPLTQVIYPLLWQGRFDRGNIGIVLGLPPLWSLVPPALATILLLRTAWRLVREPSRDVGSVRPSQP